MKIGILGAGAMGSLYGALLSREHQVWLVDIWKEHIEKIEKEGLLVEHGSSRAIYRPHAVTQAADVGVCQLVLVFVKSKDTAAALEGARELFGKETMALTLQNGYGNETYLYPYVKDNKIFLGTTAAGAVLKGPGHLFWAGDGPVALGSASGVNADQTKVLAEAFRRCGIEVRLNHPVRQAVWEKLLVNAGLNGILALLEEKNEFMASCTFAYELASRLVEEGARIALAEGIQLDWRQIAEKYYIQGAAKVGKNICSMLQDVQRKRETEIEAINGAIVRLGEKHQIATPYNRALYLLIKAKEKTYLS